MEQHSGKTPPRTTTAKPAEAAPGAAGGNSGFLAGQPPAASGSASTLPAGQGTTGLPGGNPGGTAGAVVPPGQSGALNDGSKGDTPGTSTGVRSEVTARR